MSVSRAEVISSLQGEERERQWHYTQLELISQKIRNIPLTSAQSVSTPETRLGVRKPNFDLSGSGSGLNRFICLKNDH